MKKYFAKFLPVEGEIVRNGEYYMAPDGVIRQFIGKQVTGDIKKVKLFLCNTDIQKGDELTFFWGDGRKEDGFFKRKVKALDKVGNVRKLGESEITKGHIEYEMEKEGYFWNTDFAYKIVGEISSDAFSYVKEGDEFEEKDVKFIRIDWESYGDNPTEITEKNFIKMYNGGKFRDYELTIWIKGPCGHFH